MHITPRSTELTVLIVLLSLFAKLYFIVMTPDESLMVIKVLVCTAISLAVILAWTLYCVLRTKPVDPGRRLTYSAA